MDNSNEHLPRIHGGVVYLEEMAPELASELGKIKGNLKQLWNLTKPQELNRSDIRNLVLEIRKSERYISNLLRGILQRAAQEMTPDQAASFKSASTNLQSKPISFILSCMIPMAAS